MEKPKSAAVRATQRAAPRPGWLHQAPPAEGRPPRPLAPSSLGEDDIAYPPAAAEQRSAALRGKLLHMLFERLPEVPIEKRREAALIWLERSAGISERELRSEIAEDALRIINDPVYADLFASGAYAEAPIAAVVGDGVVVAGTVDRLLVRDDRIVVADFKTGRNVPASAQDTPTAHLRQMAAYRAALQTIFPDRPVEAILIYTSGPRLHALPAELLEAFEPGGG